MCSKPIHVSRRGKIGGTMTLKSQQACSATDLLKSCKFSLDNFPHIITKGV